MRDIEPRVRERGAEIVVVGNGTPQQAKHFREERGVGFRLLVDPELNAYRAAGLRRGLFSALGVKTFGHALRAMGRGHRQGPVRGDAWQLGGTFVIAAGGEIRFAHESGEAGDHADPADVLAALPGPS